MLEHHLHELGPVHDMLLDKFNGRVTFSMPRNIPDLRRFTEFSQLVAGGTLFSIQPALQSDKLEVAASPPGPKRSVIVILNIPSAATSTDLAQILARHKVSGIIDFVGPLPSLLGKTSQYAYVTVASKSPHDGGALANRSIGNHKLLVFTIDNPTMFFASEKDLHRMVEEFGHKLQ
ncbi:hypothetical protein GGF32_008998 [Allomyces javanicus]|nr:hypothetical protein GGF32_008998 [Allomyces javanicus]